MENRLARLPPKRLRQLVEQGFRALGQGDRQLAADCCRGALREKPDFARAHYLAALIALDSGDRGSAQQALETVATLNPKFAPAWAQLARLFITAGEFVKAEACLVNAANSETGNPAVQDLIGTVFRLAGNLAASQEWHEKAVNKDDEHVPFLINLANSHKFHGDQAAAEVLLRKGIALRPRHSQLHWLLSTTVNATSMEHVDEMRRLLASESHPRSVAYLQYAIGKECEDLQAWQQAGEAFVAGAEARRGTVAYDEAADIALFETAGELFTEEWLAKQETGPNDAGPIFVVGEPRTGTTLLDRIVGAHSAVTSAGELRHLAFAIRQVTGCSEPRQFSPELLRAAACADVEAIGEAYLQSTESLRDTPHIIDKLPGNYLYLPLILAALPGARILHMRRDPMDTCFAIYKQLFADAYLYSYDQEELARHYLRYDQLMRTWRERFPERFVDVQYEDLVQDTGDVVRGILDHLDLTWDDACINYFETRAAVTTASAAQVREPPHTRSIGRWKHYEEMLNPMLCILARQ